MSKFSDDCKRQYDEHARSLKPLQRGVRVRVQNTANSLWDRTGLVVEVKPNRMYGITLDGSGGVLHYNVDLWPEQFQV